MYVNMLTSVWNSGAIIAVHVDPLNSHFSVTEFVSFSLWLFFFWKKIIYQISTQSLYYIKKRKRDTSVHVDNTICLPNTVHL